MKHKRRCLNNQGGLIFVFVFIDELTFVTRCIVGATVGTLTSKDLIFSRLQRSSVWRSLSVITAPKRSSFFPFPQSISSYSFQLGAIILLVFRRMDFLYLDCKLSLVLSKYGDYQIIWKFFFTDFTVLAF